MVELGRTYVLNVSNSRFKFELFSIKRQNFVKGQYSVKGQESVKGQNLVKEKNSAKGQNSVKGQNPIKEQQFEKWFLYVIEDNFFHNSLCVRNKKSIR